MITLIVLLFLDSQFQIITLYSMQLLENKIIFKWSAYTQFMNPHRTGYSLRGSVTRQNEPGANCTMIWSGNDNLLLPLELRALKNK